LLGAINMPRGVGVAEIVRLLFKPDRSRRVPSDLDSAVYCAFVCLQPRLGLKTADNNTIVDPGYEGIGTDLGQTDLGQTQRKKCYAFFAFFTATPLPRAFEASRAAARLLDATRRLLARTRFLTTPRRLLATT
jgi:hypothetical protein